MSCKKIYKLLFLLLFSIACLFLRCRTLSTELTDDLEKNESQIEIPPETMQSDHKLIEEHDNDINSESNYSTQATDHVPPDENTTGSASIPSSEISTNNDETNNSGTAAAAQENLGMIPVFSEWTLQQMQEAEKKLVELTNATELNKEIKNETLAKHQIVKMRQKNYASPDCGAKVLASNPEAQSTSSVLTDKDDYLLSPCTDRIWFVVELCDSIQASRVELANFELFSSPLKSVSISISNRFPTRDWTTAAHFDAKTERDVQVFELNSQLFGKFVRVDLTYTNTEHYCPLSFFRIFGTSEIEAFETVENDPSNEMNQIDDDEYETQHGKVQPNKDNLLNRAGAAVMSIVHKAAEVLAKGNDNGSKVNESVSKVFHQQCISMSHNILCQICSVDERIELDNLMSCKNFALSNLLKGNEDIKNHLVNSVTCSNILGFNLKSPNAETSRNFIISILPQKYIAAMCNIVANDQKSLEPRVEDISGISSNLIPKKDEVGLKNVSKKEETSTEEDPLCKHDFYNGEKPKAELNLVPNINEAEGSGDVNSSEQKNSTISGDEHNIFNVIEQQQLPTDTESTQQVEPPTIIPIEEETELQKNVNEDKITQKQEVIITDPIAIPAEPEIKTEQTEPKTNGGEGRASNPPESVFLRLSNRIKSLEKNMSLSTQYLEELSKRYKKQIEELQLSFSKVQTTFDDHNQRQKESEKIEFIERRKLFEDSLIINQKFDYMEVAVILLSCLLMIQTIMVIVLFKRLSNIRKIITVGIQPQKVEEAEVSSSNHVNDHKSKITNRKKSKQRMRKISAPNILTQQSTIKSEFIKPSPILSRTVSAPNKFSAIIDPVEMKEKHDDMQVMLEENDEILIPGFENLKLNDDDDSIRSNNEADTASTVSIVSSNGIAEKIGSNKSFKFKRRLSSPFQLKKSSLHKSSSQRSNMEWFKKAKSESPQRNESLTEIQKSQSFQEFDGVKLKKTGSNSFKKLFRKLF